MDLAWFERRPLFGRRVVVTRTRAAGLAARRGAARSTARSRSRCRSSRWSTPTDGGAALRAARRPPRRRTTGWSSPRRTALAACSRPSLLRAATPAPSAARQVAAIGPGTAAVLADGGHAGRPRAASASWPSRSSRRCPPPPAGGRVLLARAEVARDVLPDGLRERGLGGRRRRRLPHGRRHRHRRAARRRSAGATSSRSRRRPRSSVRGRRSAPTPSRRRWPASARSPPPPPASRGLTVDVEAAEHTDRRPRRRARRRGPTAHPPRDDARGGRLRLRRADPRHASG